jgi:type II protein arginine methyltransferase
VFPGCKVLEIGTGTGLLAMMAARAGAAQVITCETDAGVAFAAKNIVARNGFADRVKVVAKHSTALDVKADLGGPADILVSEIVSNDLLGEDALPSLEHAFRTLVKPQVKVIPVRGRVRVALASDDEWEDARMGHVGGFDLTAFNVLASPHYEILVGASRLMLKSDPADLFTFDFASGGPFPERKSDIVLRSHGRRLNGVVQWIALDMDTTGRFENAPEPGASSSWMAVFYPFDREIPSTPGQTVTVHARHDRGGLRIWADLPGPV